MKSLVRNIFFNALALFFTSSLLSGVTIFGGLWTYVLAGFVLALLSILLRPILTIITLPFQILSLGTFSFVINIAILYVLTVFLPEVSIRPFVFSGAYLGGFVIPKISINLFFAYIVTAAALSIIDGMLRWISKE